MKLKDISLRTHHANDLPFVYKSWLVNFRASNHLESLIDKVTYFEGQKNLIDRILLESTCLVAVNPEDENQIFGYMIYDQVHELNIVHYVYVKSPYRRLGIAQYLKDHVFEESKIIVTTHHTRMANVLKDKWHLIFNPYLLFDLY